MKFLKTRLIQAACIVLLTMLAASMASAQTSGIDARPSFPQVMTVDQVNLSDNIVILDGERYRLPPRPDDAGADSPAARANQGQLPFIGQLRRGMRVQVVTDGSMPTADHVPIILELEPAP